MPFASRPARKSVSTLAIAAAGALVAATPALANEPMFSFSFGLSAHDRSGDDVSATEPQDFLGLSGAGMGTYSLPNELRIQWDLSAEVTDVEEDNDGVASYTQLDLHLGRDIGPWYAGGALILAHTAFNEDEDDQNTTTFGIAAVTAYHAANYSLGGSLGFFNADARHGETMSETVFASVNGSYFLNGGNTAITAGLAYAEGAQDFDSDDDEADITEFTLGVEHGLGTEMMGGNGSFFAELGYIRATETSNTGSGTDTVNDARLTLGFRVTFGGGSVQDRVRASAPSLPDISRWQGVMASTD
jgi:hypothetical protein